MKNLTWIIAGILIVFGVVFTLATAGAKDNKSLSNSSTQSASQESNVNSKTYSNVPAVLPEAERLNKKATFDTNLGSFVVTLYGDKAPQTVSNFITLVKDNFYNGLIFHRVISDFMIQGGDPNGNGTGGPGYKFNDEVNNGLDFSKEGVLAMANSGPNTNGSQFFITVAPYTSGNNSYTIFGGVESGYDVVQKISQVQTDSNDKPTTPVTINKITID